MVTVATLWLLSYSVKRKSGGKTEPTSLPALAHSLYVKEWSDGGERPKPVGHEDLGKNWVGAGHLKVGDKIKQADGTTGIVANVLTLQQTREMFNLTVSEAHTFYVGQQGWLVHNCNVAKPSDLITTHGLTMSRKQYEKFLESVRTNGITESIKVVEHNGGLFVVDGHHRLSAAKSLGMESVPTEKVQLPFKGYKTLNDLFD